MLTLEQSRTLIQIAVIAAVVISLLIVYMLPAMVAAIRSHHNTVAIAALNLLLGWSFVGWVVAFVWALTAVREDG